jgi:hypothetical protein
LPDLHDPLIADLTDDDTVDTPFSSGAPSVEDNDDQILTLGQLDLEELYTAVEDTEVNIF